MSVPTALHWSGGKDSALALGRLLSSAEHEVRRLVTLVDGQQRSTVHGLPPRLLRAQADAVGLPLQTVSLEDPGMRDYPEVMTAVARRLRQEGIRAVAFGDLMASGARAHHERLLRPVGLDVVEPLWGMSSRECIDCFLGSGIEASVVAVDAAVLGPETIGRVVDRDLVDSLPTGCDPCGELGEFHTVVLDAPFFRLPVSFPSGDVETVEYEIGTSAGPQTFRHHRVHPG